MLWMTEWYWSKVVMCLGKSKAAQKLIINGTLQAFHIFFCCFLIILLLDSITGKHKTLFYICVVYPQKISYKNSTLVLKTLSLLRDKSDTIFFFLLNFFDGFLAIKYSCFKLEAFTNWWNFEQIFFFLFISFRYHSWTSHCLSQRSSRLPWTSCHGRSRIGATGTVDDQTNTTGEKTNIAYGKKWTQNQSLQVCILKYHVWLSAPTSHSTLSTLRMKKTFLKENRSINIYERTKERTSVSFIIM